MAILPGTRIRDNGIFGTTTDNPLTAGAATYNSAALSLLSTVAGNHALVTLDPLRQFGEPEIVMITAHTAAATVATITRGMFGTIARSHPVSTLWVHAAADNDFIEVLTSATRPVDQYEGQFIFETDTNKLVGFGGVDWAPRDAGGQLGYSQAVTNQAAITADVALTNLSVAVTVGTNRRIKITGVCVNSVTVAGQVNFRLKQDTIQIQEAPFFEATAASAYPRSVSFVLTPSAGAHTYNLSMSVDSGGGTATMLAGPTVPAYILVEDIGAA